MMKKALFTTIFYCLILSLSFGQNDKLFGFNHSTVFTLDLVNGLIDTLATHEEISGITGHTFDGLNDHYILLSAEKVFLIDSDNGTIVNQLDFPVVEIEYDSKNEQLLGYNQSSLFALDLNSGGMSTIGNWPELTSIGGLAYDSNSGHIVVLTLDEVYVVDPENGDLINQLDFPVVAIEYDTNSGSLLGYNESQVYTLDLKTGEINTIADLETITSISDHTFDTNNHRLILAVSDQVFTVDLSNGNIQEQFTFPAIGIEFGNANLVSALNPFLKEEFPIHVFPNPTKGKINIQTPTDFPLDLSIYNAQGILLQEIKLAREIDFSDFDPGVYNLVFKNDLKVQTKVVVKMD